MLRMLDAYCCQGGSAAGYSTEFDHITGVDIDRQPKYPYTFVRGDAIQYINEWGVTFDAIHASPPCQYYSNTWQLNCYDHPDLIEPTRKALQKTGKPYVIENVPGAPLKNPVELCGCMFGIRTYRPRLFEVFGFELPQPAHKSHIAKLAKMGRPVKSGEFLHVVGNFSGVALGKQIMEMPWANRDGLREATPVSYTRYIAPYLAKVCQ